MELRRLLDLKYKHSHTQIYILLWTRLNQINTQTNLDNYENL
jgi:hypothetical protein